MPSQRRANGRRQATAEEEGMPSDDEIQIFHKQRSRQMDSKGSDNSESETESEVEEVLAMESKAADDDSDSDDDSGDDDEPVGTKGWGSKRSTFYNGADYESGSDDSDEAHEAEEAEAKRLQSHRAKLLQDSDFMGDSEEDDGTTSDELRQPSKNKNMDKKKKASRSARTAAQMGEGDDEGLERLSKDLSLLNDAEKLQLLNNDAPELLELLNSFTASLTEIRSQIAPLIQQVRSGTLPTSNGSSFLEVKFHLLLSYCINVVFYIFLKSKGEPVKNHPVIATLVKLRVLIEKCRPIDKKLKYQLDKLLASASNPGGAASTGALSHRPRPQEMIGDDGADNSDGEEDDEIGGSKSTGLYTVPKISAAHYENANEVEKARKKAAAKRGRALKSDLIKSMQEEFGEAPMEIKGIDDSGMRGQAAAAAREAKEREQYEEDNFVRLTLSKKDKAKEKLRARAANGMLADEFDTEQFSSLAGLIDNDSKSAVRLSKAQAREDKKRRSLAKYLNDIEQKQKSAARARKNARSADSDSSFEPKQTKKRKPNYDLPLEEGEGADTLDNFGGGEAASNASDDSDDDFYKQAVQNKQSKRRAKDERRARGNDELAEARDMKDGGGHKGKRAASSAIIKNRGLTPHRKKIDRNPRVKKKVKYAKKVKQGRASGISGARVNTSVGGASHYSGESTGINAKISRSQRFN